MSCASRRLSISEASARWKVITDRVYEYRGRNASCNRGEGSRWPRRGRVARILTTLHRVAGTPVSEALKRRQRSAIQRGDAGTHSGTVSQWRKRKDRQRRREQFEGAAKETGLPHGYHSGMRILLVGEGNLSFALALTTLFDGDGSNLLVTSFDRQRIARAAYPYCEDVEESLTESGAAVVFDVDVEEPGALRGVAKRWWAPGTTTV